MKLNPFDENECCPKCSYDSVRTRYIAQGDARDDDEFSSYPKYHKWPKHEFLMRICQRCDYQWAQATLMRTIHERMDVLADDEA